MNKNKIKLPKKLALIVLMFIFSLTLILNITPSYAMPISIDEASSAPVSYLRYGYDVTSGKPFYEGTPKKFPILSPIENGLYKQVVKTENDKSVRKTFNASSNNPIDVANDVKFILDGGINSNVGLASLNVNKAFNTTTPLIDASVSRYELYYQTIEKSSYEFKEDTNFVPYLTPEFLNAAKLVVDGVIDSNTFFEKYGTHLFTSLSMGGLFSLSNYQTTNDENIDVINDTGLSAKVDKAILAGNNQLDFSFNEEFINKENSNTKTSNYVVSTYGGNALAGFNVEQLFNLHSSVNPSTGNKTLYSSWVDSINNNVNIIPLGLKENGNAIAVWDLLPQTEEYYPARCKLMEGYIQKCQAKYEEFINANKIPNSNGNVIVPEDPYEVMITGYSLEKNGYIEENKLSSDNIVYNNSILKINHQKLATNNVHFEVTTGKEFVETRDANKGIFFIKDNCVDKPITINCLTKNNDLILTTNFKAINQPFSGGQGTKDNPYVINTANDFLEITKSDIYWDKYFILNNDIKIGLKPDNTNPKEINGIGSAAKPFTGVFDGNYHTIYEFSLSSPKDNALGLFNFNSGTIANLGVGKNGYKTQLLTEEATDKLSSNSLVDAGSIVGLNAGIIDNCIVENMFMKAKDIVDDGDHDIQIGGLVGRSITDRSGKPSQISNCVVRDCSQIAGVIDNLNGKRNGVKSCRVGGLIGYAQNVYIVNSTVNNIATNSAYARGKDAWVSQGGFVGKADKEATFETCILGNTNYFAYNRSYGTFSGSKKFTNVFVGESKTSTYANCYAAPYTGQDEKKNYTKTGVENGCQFVSNLSVETCNLSKDWINHNGFPTIANQVNFTNLDFNIDTKNVQKDFYIGEKFNADGLLIYKNGKKYINDYVIDSQKFNNQIVGTYPIKIKILNKILTYEVNVHKIKVEGVEITPKKEIFYDSDILTKDLFNINYLLEDGTKLDINNLSSANSKIELPLDNAVTFSNNTLHVGKNTIVINVGSFSKTLTINAKKDTIKNIYIDSIVNKTGYYIGERLNLDGLVVKANTVNNKVLTINNKDLEFIGEIIHKGNNEITIAYQNHTVILSNIIGSESFYEITFMDDDNNLIEKIEWAANTIGKVPSTIKNPDNVYTYTFLNWDKEFVPATQNTTYVAHYQKEYINYTVEFLDGDGKIFETKENCHYGDKIIPPLKTPSKTNTDGRKYIFVGWDIEDSKVTGNMQIKPKFTYDYISYKVTFKNYDGTVIQSRYYNYGDKISFPKYYITPKDTNLYHYVFEGWDNEDIYCHNEATFTTSFKQCPREYTVKFYDAENHIIKNNSNYNYGDLIEYPTVNPTKKSDSEYDYEFYCWDNGSKTVNGNIEFKPLYIKRKRTDNPVNKINMTHVSNVLLDNKQEIVIL